MLGEAWFIVKPLKESVIGEVSKSQTERLRVADSPEMVRRDPVEMTVSGCSVSFGVRFNPLLVCLVCTGGKPASSAPTKCDFRLAVLKKE